MRKCTLSTGGCVNENEQRKKNCNNRFQKCILIEWKHIETEIGECWWIFISISFLFCPTTTDWHFFSLSPLDLTFFIFYVINIHTCILLRVDFIHLWKEKRYKWNVKSFRRTHTHIHINACACGYVFWSSSILQSTKAPISISMAIWLPAYFYTEFFPIFLFCFAQWNACRHTQSAKIVFTACFEC